MITPNVVITISEDDARMFLEFQKLYKVFKESYKYTKLIHDLEAIKAFNIRSGSVTLGFDANGVISQIKKEEHFVTKLL